MTVPASKIPVSIDYTSRDYYSLRNALLLRLQERIPEWKGDDPADFGVALVEAFSYMGDVSSYYIDRIANEGLLNTATQRKSILAIANNYGYSPAGYRSAYTTIKFANKLPTLTAPITAVSGDGAIVTYTAANTYSVGQVVIVNGCSTTAYNVPNGAAIIARNDTSFQISSTATGTTCTGSSIVGNNLTIPAGTEVSGQVTIGDSIQTVVFTTTSNVTITGVAAGSNSHIGTVSARHGSSSTMVSGNNATYGEKIGESTQLPDQKFTLLENQVVDGSVKVYVSTDSGSTYTAWTYVAHLADYGPKDTVFTLSIDDSDYVSVQFGDGVSGAIPTIGAIIRSKYTIGGGTIGNVGLGAITTLRAIPNLTSSQTYALNQSVNTTNTTFGIGGSDPESNDSIRINAPLALRTLNRAVTLQDYQDLAVTVTGVGKAKATAESRSAVTLYVSPQRNADDTDVYPGFDSSNVTKQQEQISLESDVVSYLADRTQIGTTVTVLPPTYVNVTLSVSYTKFDGYSSNQIEQAIQNALLDNFNYFYMLFGDTISPQELEAGLRRVEGVQNLTVDLLYKTGDSAAKTVLVGKPSDIFVFAASRLTVTEKSTVSSLSGLTFSTGTLSPTFSSSFYNYNLTVATGTTTMNVTPTLSGASITVNGTAVTSGSATAVALPTTTTTVSIVVVAANSVNTNTYTITVTKV
jgi:hypothetical protein